MISWKPVFQTNLQSTCLANGSIGECQRFFTSLNRASWFLLLPWITIPGLLMFLQYHLLLIFFACYFDRRRTDFAYNHLPTVMFRFRTFMRLTRSMFHTKHLHRLYKKLIPTKVDRKNIKTDLHPIFAVIHKSLT